RPSHSFPTRRSSDLKTFGNCIEANTDNAQQDHVYTDRQSFASQQFSDTGGVASGAAGKAAVEPGKEAAEDFIYQASQPVFRCIMTFQQQRGQGRAERERVDR